MNDCIFCKIINREIPSTIVYEDDLVIAFEDISAQAPVHTLVVPKKHIKNVLELEDPQLMAAVFNAIRKVANIKGVDESGFRLIANTGDAACQTVKHLHFHILGGKQLTEKMD
ncbi:MAG: histidine triad nucleotide-binding protein [Christensenellaceae bacterium]|nr:histidine triad nucleotide-binding protein [Christensenellaceae bacterium]